MTWLSRLLPQSPSLQRLADHNHRTRQGQRRRRMATLETLEGRTLLSNVVTSITQDAITGANTLTITGDAHNDAFKVTEETGGLVQVVGSDNKTQINSLPVGQVFTTTQAITTIDINILTGTSANTNNVTLTSTVVGKGTIQNVVVSEPGYSATLPAPVLNLTVTSVKNTGTLSVNDGTPGTYVGGTLNATVSGSQFTALTIDQVGCCPATVALNNDVVPGAVSVTEGTANNDSVTATGDDFGATTISQFVGLNPNGQTGSGDFVSVDDSVVEIFSLAVTQSGTGTGQQILIGTVGSGVEVALTGFITASQPNDLATNSGQGSDNTIQIISITTVGTSNNPHLVPDSIVTDQGNGNDTTTVDNA